MELSRILNIKARPQVHPSRKRLDYYKKYITIMQKFRMRFQTMRREHP